jgi:SnoaL-like domain
MPASDLSKIAVESMLLQNGYALAIDAREWDYFRTLFTSDVQAHYPHSSFNGMDDWLGNFIPFHDTCGWTSHVITNHVVGEDGHGIWAACYGWVQWTMNDKPGLINRATVLFRDRLVSDGGTWRIARRKLNVLMDEIGAPIPDGVVMRPSILNLADWS